MPKELTRSQVKVVILIQGLIVIVLPVTGRIIIVIPVPRQIVTPVVPEQMVILVQGLVHKILEEFVAQEE